jgi:hypothetical protein
MRNQVWALMIIGSDDDIAGYTISHLLAEGIDRILIDLVPVEDETATIVRDLQARHPNQIEIFPSDSISIWGSRRMTTLANIAYERGVELMLPCDSDELFFSRNGNSLTDEIRNGPGTVFSCPVFMHLASAEDDATEVNPYRRMTNKQTTPLGLDKIFLRFNSKMEINEGNHGAKWLNGASVPGSETAVEIRHFPYRSAEQFVKKVEVTERAMLATPGYPQGWGIHYRTYSDTLHRAGPDALKDWYRRWFHLGSSVSENQNFVIDPAPYKGAP